MQTRRDPIALAISGPLAAAALLVCVSSSGAAPAAPGESPLPTNLIVPEVVRPLVVSMLRKSPTFRRQCTRLAEQPKLLVHIRLVDGIRDGLALSLVERRGAGREAAVWIELRQPARYVEAIAHELEHVLEQVEGTDSPGWRANELTASSISAGRTRRPARSRSVERSRARRWYRDAYRAPRWLLFVASRGDCTDIRRIR